MSEDYDDIDRLIDMDPIELGRRCRAAEKVASAAEAILNPMRGDAPWLHTVEFDDLRAALARWEALRFVSPLEPTPLGEVGA